MEKKLLILDLEGTIITNEKSSNQKSHSQHKIAPELKEILKAFHNNSFTIVLATLTTPKQLKTHQPMLSSSGIAPYIDAKWPQGYNHNQSKNSLLRNYKNQFNIENADTYYFDDSSINIALAKKLGIDNSFLVTEENPLVTQLQELANELQIEIASEISTDFDFSLAERTKKDLFDAQKDNNKLCFCQIM